MWLRDRRVRVIGSILLGLVLVNIACWLLQSPVPSGMYPARVGGIYYSNNSSPTYDLPIVWVRPFPWSKEPPRFDRVALMTSEGERSVSAGAISDFDWWHYGNRPAWLLPRVILGHMTLYYPKEGLKVDGLSWQPSGERLRVIKIGEITLAWANPDYGSLRFGGFSVESEYRVIGPNGKNLIGHYVMISGSGRLVDIVPSTAGSERPISGLLYREGGERGHVHFSDPVYQPLRFPYDLTHKVSTIYMPLSDNARERLSDTWCYFRPILIIEDQEGFRHEYPLTNTSYGLPGRKWRSWVPFFVYTSEPMS